MRETNILWVFFAISRIVPIFAVCFGDCGCDRFSFYCPLLSMVVVR